MKLSVDTNVLIYATDRNAGPKHRPAFDLVRNLATCDAALVEQSLIEYLNVAIVKVRQPLQDAATIVREWLLNFALLVPTGRIVEDTLSLLTRYKLSVWDARLLAVCNAHHCDVLFSEDLQDNGIYGAVRVLNPFNPSNVQTVAEALQS